MNAVYALSARLDQARRVGSEKLGGGSSNNKQFNDYPATDVLKDLFDKSTDTVLTPRVLKDGADSVGALGALNRVYLNIGMASDEWLRHFMPLIGPTQKHGPVTPIQIADLRNVSSFWRANEEQTPALAAFFLASAKPDYLKDAPGGAARLAASAQVMDRGKDVFAERCARCHSSKTPPLPDSVAGGTCAGGGNGPQYLDCWDKYWKHTWTPEFKDAMKAIVRAPDFLEGNFLSSERRIPVTLLETNACSPLATNALKGNIWDNFSSQSYKELPSVGPITVYSPIDGKEIRFEMPADGRGYTRPASLISLWSTAPYLLNNSVGTFNPDPSVEGRLASFDDSIRQMLWPERRQKDSLVPSLPGYIQRTTARSSLSLPVGYLPDKLQQLIGWKRYLPYDGAHRHRGRADSGRHAGRPARQPGADLRGSIAAGAHRLSGQADRRPDQAAGRSEVGAGGGHRRAGTRGVPRRRPAADGDQQVPRLRRQSRPLLRHEHVQA